MNPRAAGTLASVLALLLFSSASFGQAISPGSSAAEPVPARSERPFAQPELDQMLAPIALYPDALLSQILMAATYPLEVVEAARWSKANPGLTGQDAVKAVEGQSWDPSIKSLVAFPQVLAKMDERLEWTESLGDAFLAQQAQVMSTVQGLRQKAQAAGTLQPDDKQTVTSNGQAITMAAANPDIVYVPYYDPWVVYGPWWWPAYPPVFWAMWPGYYVGPGFRGRFWWGPGYGVGPGFFYGGFNWRGGYVNCGPPNFYYHGPPGWYRPPIGAPPGWVHDPWHRRGVPYPQAGMRDRFVRMGAPVSVRRDLRGRESPAPAPGRPSAGPAAPGRPVREGGPGGVSRPGEARNGGGPPRGGEGRPHAFEGVGHGEAVRHYSARGHASGGGRGRR